MKIMFNNVSQWILLEINLQRHPKQYETFQRLNTSQSNLLLSKVWYFFQVFILGWSLL